MPRRVAWRCWTALLAVAGIGCGERRPTSPPLGKTEAAALISARPEFNRYATLLAVTSTDREGDSLKDCCYNAEFTFVQKGHSDPIQARAQFRWWNDKWHLHTFTYGKEFVHVSSNEPSQSK
jgi:hypothetical protein